MMMTALTIGCSQDDAGVPGGNGELPSGLATPIAFTANRQDEQAITRATPLEGTDGSGITSFTVFGFKNMGVEGSDYTEPQQVFPGYTVKWVTNTVNTSTTNSDGWEYVNQQAAGKDEQTIKYWDWNAKAYRFFAIAGTSNTNIPTGTYKPNNVNPDRYEVTYEANAEKEAEIPYYSHLWFSDGSPGQTPFGQPVQLVFIKPLSWVRIMFIFEENTEPDATHETNTTLTDITFCPSNGNTIKLNGNVFVSYPLTGTGTTETFAATSEAEGILALTQDYYETKTVGGETVYPYYNASGHTPREYTVLPVADQDSYKLTVRVNGEPKTTIVPAEFMDWLPGYKYTYIFKVHGDGSVGISSVQSAFKEWISHTESHTVYNW
jgi:hypothetical protein